jgi:UDP-N-acetyl-2-amino-2-deoxyglucuronate dehydrogenase
VRWFLSINADTLPKYIKEVGGKTYRSLTFEGEEIEFSDGFTELHTHSYKDIIDGHGFGLEEAMHSIQIVHNIRHSNPIGLIGDYHPLANGVLAKHPFSK